MLDWFLLHVGDGIDRMLDSDGWPKFKQTMAHEVLPAAMIFAVEVSLILLLLRVTS